MRTLKRNNSGQALIEMAFVAPLLLVFVFGLVDFSRAMYDLEVITNLAGEGSSQASRGGNTPQQLAVVVVAVMSDADINMNGKGCVIVTAINSPSSGSYKITNRASSNPCNAGTSKIGTCTSNGSGYCTGTASGLPSGVTTVLGVSSNITMYVTEVSYNYAPVTPIGALLHTNNWLPSQLYRAAYY